MTPKEKADGIIQKFAKVEIHYFEWLDDGTGQTDSHNAQMEIPNDAIKQCAIISVKDTIHALHVGSTMQDFYLEVQKEIEKL